MPNKDTKINPESLCFLIYTGKYDEATAMLNKVPFLKKYLINPVAIAIQKRTGSTKIMENYFKSNPEVLQYIHSASVLKSYESHRKAAWKNSRIALSTRENIMQLGD